MEKTFERQEFDYRQQREEVADILINFLKRASQKDATPEETASVSEVATVLLRYLPY